jgi:hypothetical protein
MRHPVCHLETEREYFHRLDVELIDDMRRRAAFEERRQRIAEACRTEDPRILAALEKLGYDQDTVTLLYLVPLVQVAWLDGSVNQAERNRIRVMAGLQGVRENLAAYRQLMEWLDRRPSDEFFNGTVCVIRILLESLPENEQKECKEALIRRCREVAFASCGLFGWKSKICFVKRIFIRELAKLLEPKPQAASARAGT